MYSAVVGVVGIGLIASQGLLAVRWAEVYIFIYWGIGNGRINRENSTTCSVDAYRTRWVGIY